MRRLTFILFLSINVTSCRSQPPGTVPATMKEAAVKFLETLSGKEKTIAQFSFADDERFNWHFIPKSRKGLPLEEMNAEQRKAAFDMLRLALGDTGYRKTTAIVELEDILRQAENRPQGDEYRDAGKYYLSIFGDPSNDPIWCWRFEGHHVSLNFSSENNQLVSGTPGFLGTNPAIVLSGPEKGKQVLKDETELGLQMLQSLDESQQKKAILADKAGSDMGRKKD